MMTEKSYIDLVLEPFTDKIQNALYLNAFCGDNGLKNFEGLLQNSFKPVYDLLPQGFNKTPILSHEAQSYDHVLIQGSKNSIETKALIFDALYNLKDGGTLSICAGNKSGGTRLKKLLQEAGLDNIQDYSKHKARVVWGIKGNHIDANTIQKWHNAGQPQSIANGQYQSWPGIFGWDKIDKGSSLLIEMLNTNSEIILKGRGADFGCGYGYLSCEAAKNHTKIKKLTCIDADARSIEMCKINTAQYDDIEWSYEWADLTRPTKLKNLDFIIMNPPFHEGKITDQSIGQDFITNAALSLKKYGQLFMVANSHLAYEECLQQHFFKCEKIFEKQGFKGYMATR